ncbi:MAG: hypothetical protein ABFD92_17545 [Planctomycetaceae bacterium]|nr:hypothetical protein [Planctomycetaceae bacterium]
MWQDIAIGAVLVLLAAAAIYRILLAGKGKGGCGCDRRVFPRESHQSQDPNNASEDQIRR